MPDISNKGRILRLLQYLYLNTDEEHAATKKVIEGKISKFELA